MQSLRTEETIAAKVLRAIAERDVAKESVASAADMTTAELETFLAGGDIELCKLADVGGFLRIPLPDLLEGVNA